MPDKWESHPSLVYTSIGLRRLLCVGWLTVMAEGCACPIRPIKLPYITPYNAVNNFVQNNVVQFHGTNRTDSRKVSTLDYSKIIEK